MALPVEFIERVVAWPGSGEPGYVNAHWLAPEGKGGGMRGKPFTSLQEFMDFVQYAATKPGTYKEVFFCLSTQAITGKLVHNRPTAHRHQSKALKMKALWLDVDVKPLEPEKAYTSLKEALHAINDLVAQASLPPPSAFVFSGGGVHVYWISDRALTVDEWRPFAEGLKLEALRVALKCDAGLTTDCARVLRVPGTFNNKIQGLPRPVKLAHLGASYSFDTDPKFQRLKALAPAVVRNVVTGAVTAAIALPAAFSAGPDPRFAHLDAQGDTLASGIGRRDSDLPLDAKEVFKGCEHFKDSFRRHGAGQSQGLWMLTGLASTWFENGRKIYHTLSKGYPAYSKDETDTMFDRKAVERKTNDLGWPSCTAFEGEGAKCKTCPFYGKLRSPLHLAERVQPPEPLPPQVLPPPPEEDMILPDGWVLDENGWIAKVIEKELANGETKTAYLPLFMCKIKDLQAQGGDRRLTFNVALDKGHWKEVTISEAKDMINDTTIIAALRGQGVKPYTLCPPKEITHFMTTFLAKIDLEVERQRTTSFGWLRPEDEAQETQKPIGFAYGGKVHMNDGSTRLAGHTDGQLRSFYQPKGSPEPWWVLHRKITAQHHPGLECIAATGFAGPLQSCTGQYNAVICSYSLESGAHKSTSMAAGAGVWGNPKMTKEKPFSTQKGILRKMGFLRNLPVFWDEINSDALMDDIRDILGGLSEGTDGSKLRSNRDFHDIGEWQTLMQVGSNCSLCANVLRVVKNTDAAFQRVFEYVVEKRPDNESITEMDRLVGSLQYNYGHMGLAYSKLIAQNFDRVDAMVEQHRKRFEDEVSAKSEERMRTAAVATIYVGAKLANELGCDFHTEEMWDFLKDAFLAQRLMLERSDVVVGSADNSANSLTQFLKQHNQNALWVGELAAKKMGQPAGVVWLAGPNKQRPMPIHVRLSVGDKVIDVSKQRFEDFLALQKITPSTVIDGLRKHFGAFHYGRQNLAAGSGILGGKEPVIRIPVADDGPFADDLYANGGRVTAAVTGIDPAAVAQAAADLSTVQQAA